MPRSVFERHRPIGRPRAAGSPVVAAMLTGFTIAVMLVLLAAATARLRRVPVGGALPASLAALDVVRGPMHVRAPVALLYIDRSCAHCRPAAIRFDSLVRRTRVSAYIVSNDRRDSGAALERYAALAGVRATGLALDTGHALAHAERLAAVPALVLVDRFGTANVVYGAPVRLTRTGASP
jgi:hypothetical protein